MGSKEVVSKDGVSSYISARSLDENLVARWITVAKDKREEFVRSQTLRTPIQVTERDPNYEDPVKRGCTDMFGIFFLGALLIVWAAGVFYCLQFSDIGRIRYGYDSCGHVCGETPNCAKMALERTPVGLDCKNSCARITKEQRLVEFQKTNFIVYNPDEINRTCVSVCSPGFIQVLSKCIPFKGTEVGNTIFHLVGYEKVAQEIAEDLAAAWPFVTVTVLMCTVLCLLVLPALRYYAYYAIWIVLMTTLVCSVIASVYSWNLFTDASSLGKVDEHGRDLKYTYLFTSVGSTIAAINVLILMVAVKAKIKWVAELFAQCAKFKISLPRLLLLPVTTFVIVSVICFTGCYLGLVIESSGHLNYGAKTVTLEKDFFMEFTKWFNYGFGLVLIFFVIGIQDYVVASSVVHLFFTRDRETLGYPVFRSIRQAFRYHIGSIAMFSAITKVNAVGASVLSQLSFRTGAPCAISRFCCACLCREFCKLLLGLNERSYVTMSMFGLSFLQSGMEAYLITFGNRNAFVQVLETGRHLVLFVKVLVVLAGFFIGNLFYLQLEHIQHLGFLVFFTCVLAYIISMSLTAVFELTLMAILICYCLDCQLNDGVDKPYYMSPDLAEFIQKAELALQDVVIDKPNGDKTMET